MTIDQRIAQQMAGELDLPGEVRSNVTFSGSGELPSAFSVTAFASAAIATAALSIAALLRQQHGEAPSIDIDRRLSSFWFQSSVRPVSWSMGPPWDSIAGDYACRDGWIRLHTNAPHHRAAAQRILGAHHDRADMARAVARWDKTELESAIVAAGGCAAEMRSIDAWRRHAQGGAVADEPLVHTALREGASRPGWRVPLHRPLDGIRVLDLTRVLAGPVATRFLAGYGAQVLRVDPAGWDEPAVAPEVNLGKRNARLDLRLEPDRVVFAGLLSTADVLVHGLRPGALEALGFGASERRLLNPGLVDIGLDAYGWSGPWALRRGFDSLVQMSAGIADAGMAWRGADQPVPLPAQVLDHATGYLMAAAAVRGIAQRLGSGEALTARLSLARTAMLLLQWPSEGLQPPLEPETAADHSPGIEQTSWGEAQRLRPPAIIAGTPMRWDLPARQLGSDDPSWL